MNISLKKISVLTQFKTRELLKNKTFLLSLFMAPAFVLVYRFAFSTMLSENAETANGLFAMILRMGILFTTVMISLMMPATLLAKDKEKNTLRTLMTSSVSGIDYFISSILPVLVITLLVNIIVLFISGAPMTTINLPIFFIVVILCSFASSILGMIIGIFSKNQVAASNNTVMFMMILLMVPMMADMIEILQTFNDFIFTGIAANMINGFLDGVANPLTIIDWFILIGSCVGLFIIYLFFYNQNGFEKE